VAEVRLDHTAIHDLLNGPDGPVTRLMTELSERVATVARVKVRVRSSPRTPRSDSAPRGFTKASIRADVHWHQGLVYGGAVAAEEPTFFLEDPAEQLERRYPFMSTAIDTLEL